MNLFKFIQMLYLFKYNIKQLREIVRRGKDFGAFEQKLSRGFSRDDRASVSGFIG